MSGNTELGCEDTQQCVERALKAIITAAGGNPKQTHNIPHLIEQARETGERTPAAVQRTVTLTQFAGERAGERVRVLVPGIGLDVPISGTHRNDK